MKNSIIIFFILISISGYSQSNNDKARVKYFEAQEAFEQGDYQSSITYLKDAISYLGETKPIIQALLVKSYYKFGKLETANTESQKYFTLSDRSTDLDREMVQISQEIESKIQKQKIANLKGEKDEETWQKAVAENTIEQYKLYASVYPTGKHIAEAKYKIDYFGVKYSTNPTTLKKHIDKYPNGRHTRELKEEYYYYNAVDRNYIEDYDTYAVKYPNGKYITKALSKIEYGYKYTADKAKQSNDFDKAIKYYKLYINRFSSGSYINEINNSLQDIYFKRAEQMYSTNLYDSEQLYKDYVQAYPYGKYSKQCRNRINEISTKRVMDNKRRRRTSRTFIVYSYEKDIPNGLAIGGLQKWVSGYFSVKISDFTEEVTNYSIDNDGQLYNVEDNKITISPLEITDNIHRNCLALSGGITYPLFFPVWGYTGIGISFGDELWQIELQGETTWTKNRDVSFVRAVAEAGIIIDFGGFNTKIGLATDGFNNLSLSLGIGISWY